jgi:hypothetical protein
MANLTVSDIKDELIKPIVTADTSYLDRADEAFYSLASKRGVEVSDLELTTLPYIVKEYLKAFVGYEVCFYNKGLNNKLVYQDEVAIDVYAMKLEDYKSKLVSLEGEITKAVLTGEADTPEEYAYSFGRAIRG